MTEVQPRSFLVADKVNNNSAASGAAVELPQKLLVLTLVFLSHIWHYRQPGGISVVPDVIIQMFYHCCRSRFSQQTSSHSLA